MAPRSLLSVYLTLLGTLFQASSVNSDSQHADIDRGLYHDHDIPNILPYRSDTTALQKRSPRQCRKVTAYTSTPSSSTSSDKDVYQTRTTTLSPVLSSTSLTTTLASSGTSLTTSPTSITTTSSPRTPTPFVLTAQLPGTKKRQEVKFCVSFSGQNAVLVGTSDQASAFTIESAGAFFTYPNHYAVGTPEYSGAYHLQFFSMENGPAQISDWSISTGSLTQPEATFCVTASQEIYMYYDVQPAGCTKIMLNASYDLTVCKVSSTSTMTTGSSTTSTTDSSFTTSTSATSGGSITTEVTTSSSMTTTSSETTASGTTLSVTSSSSTVSITTVPTTTSTTTSASSTPCPSNKVCQACGCSYNTFAGNINGQENAPQSLDEGPVPDGSPSNPYSCLVVCDNNPQCVAVILEKGEDGDPGFCQYFSEAVLPYIQQGDGESYSASVRVQGTCSNSMCVDRIECGCSYDTYTGYVGGEGSPDPIAQGQAPDDTFNPPATCIAVCDGMPECVVVNVELGEEGVPSYCYYFGEDAIPYIVMTQGGNVLTGIREPNSCYNSTCVDPSAMTTTTTSAGPVITD